MVTTVNRRLQEFVEVSGLDNPPVALKLPLDRPAVHAIGIMWVVGSFSFPE